MNQPPLLDELPSEKSKYYRTAGYGLALLLTGIASIGGAGTFDGIVLSGIVAAYLA